MVVNAKGRAVTQRVEPSLALVEVDMPPEAFAEDWQPHPDSNSHTMGTTNILFVQFKLQKKFLRSMDR